MESAICGEREPEPVAPQLKLRQPAGCIGMAAMRCLGIDYGARRIGLSYGDELGVATPLPALTQSDAARRWDALVALIAQRRITDIVIGYPLNMDDTAGFKAKEVDAFAKRLRESLNLPVHLVDERLTSYEAESTIAKSKRRDVRASGIIDSRAATIILQDFLLQKFGLPPPQEE
jgi:putative Holliday junction resolvase